MEEELIKAPFDEKNVTTDWIEELFDDQTALYNNGSYLGYIGGSVVYVWWFDNSLKWMILRGDKYSAVRTLTARHNELFPEEESPFIIKHYGFDDVLVWQFYWKPEE